MRSFMKRGDAAAFFKTMLDRYRPGKRVSDEDGLDVAILLERHTEYLEGGLWRHPFPAHDDRARDAMLPDRPHRWQRHRLFLAPLHLAAPARP